MWTQDDDDEDTPVRRAPYVDGAWGRTANPNTADGELQNLAAFGDGLARLSGTRRTAARVVVWLILIGTVLTVVYGILGGTPLYLEQWDDNASRRANLLRLFADPALLRSIVGLGNGGSCYLLSVWRTPDDARRLLDSDWASAVHRRYGERYWGNEWTPESEFGNWDGLRLRGEQRRVPHGRSGT